MKELIQRIEALEQVSIQLEPTKSQREAYVKQLQDYTNDFVESTEASKAFRFGQANYEPIVIDGQTTELNNLLKVYSEQVVNKGINPASGGHIGYIPGGGIYTAALGDFLADVTNEFAGMNFASPGAVAIEQSLLDWMKSIFGFPISAVGNLTSGGSIANLIALTSARDKHQIKGDKIAQSVIYTSAQVHHCIHKAIRIIGLEDIQIRTIELDEFYRIKTNHLKERISEDQAAGLNPFMIIASAGTTDTGAIDPLEEMGQIAHQHNLWYHVDAAYGGFFILTKQKKALFKGIELADSLVIDPHKGLFLPYGIGAVLVKDREAVFHSHHYTANYMQDANIDQSVINPADLSPELTKHFRGLRMWLPLRMHGTAPFVACLEEKLLLTTYFRNCLLENGFCVGPEPDLSVSYFWYPTQGVDQNQFNQRLMQMIHEDGRVFLSSTSIKDQFVIRIAILSFRTKLKTIDKAMNMILTALDKVKAEY